MGGCTVEVYWEGENLRVGTELQVIRARASVDHSWT